MKDELEISIVLPCLNEAETLEGCLLEAFTALQTCATTGEVIVADNGSTDGSIEIARRSGARLVTVPSKGYGSALLGGIKAARGKFVLMGDADGSYDFRELSRFLERLRQGDELVMGCRFPRCGGKILPGAMPWKHRWIGNPILSGLGKLFFSAQVHDFHCGLRAFKKEALLGLDLKTGGMEFASEMVVKATLNRFKIGQVPITLRPDGRSRPPHLRSWRDGWRHLRFMLLYSPKWLFILPGLLLTLAGTGGFLLLFAKPLVIGRGIALDLNSLLVSSTAVLVGFQVLAFGLFIKAFAVNMGLLPGREYWLKIVRGRAAEWGIGIGMLFALSGLCCLGYAVFEWKAAGFGALSYQKSLRMTILAVTLIGVGIQAAVFGFVLNVLGLKR